MMLFRIHFERSDSSEDSVYVQGETIEEIREKAEYEVSIRNGKNPWSEEIK